MKINQKRIMHLIVILAFMAVLSSCGGLPDEDIQKAEQIPATLKQVKELIANKKNANENYLNSEPGKVIKPYALKEKWNQFFTQASAELQKGETIYNKTITAIIKKDDENDLVNLRVAMIKMNRHLVSARTTANKAISRKDFLFATIKNAPDLVSKAKSNLKRINSLLSVAKRQAEKPAIDYPAKKEDINKRYQVLNSLRDKSIESLALAEAEFEKINSKSCDYAILGDSTKYIADTLIKLTKDVPALKAKFDELYRSYAKTLIDMRIDYFVQIGRTSWDEYSDYNTEHNYTYTSQVAQAVANYFDGLGEGALARGNSRGSLRVSIDKRMWSALKINPTLSWSRGDNSSEFWVSNLVYKYYHKYLITENDKQTETKWMPVKADYFWKNQKNLGLTLLSKPYGMYEEEANKSASPPGMEYIAKPIMQNGKATGNNQYGQWKQDSSGASFWDYYLAYSFMRLMLGGSSYHPYYYNDWNGYNSRKRGTAYYGSGNRYGTYGSATYNNPRYKNSRYSKQNPGLKTADGRKRMKSASVRNSGPRSRSRGPSGGGK
jgi:hypothetical protein